MHPTQLYLAGAQPADLLRALYFWFRPRKRFHGEVFAWLLIGKGVFRSLVEIWRADERGVLFGWLSTSQILSVPLVALGIWLLVRRAARRRRDAGARRAPRRGAMKPTLLALPARGARPRACPAYGLAVALGIAVGILLAARQAPARRA